ncbi:hypothetical protein DVQ88_08435 [Yersinia enterocolitica]|nr:hypothetical protein [Yersinia enterocolitica]
MNAYATTALQVAHDDLPISGQDAGNETTLPWYGYLYNEGVVSKRNTKHRLDLATKFRILTPSVFARLRHLQPQSGCFNKCSFCSQSASSRIVEFDWDILEDIVAAIRIVTIEQNISSGIFSSSIHQQQLERYFAGGKSLIANERSDRPGVVYSYLDNDPALYPKIDQLAKLLYENLGVKTRIATVGFSRHNSIITSAFERISTDYQHYVAGVRLSVSPYTYGWSKAAERAQLANRAEFEKDLAHFLTLFRDGMLASGDGRKGVCAEIRFAPMVHATDVITDQINGHFVLKAENYVYVALHKGDLTQSSPVLLDPSSHDFKVATTGIPVWQISVADVQSWQNEIRRALESGGTGATQHRLHKLENEDGHYYGIDVERTLEGYHFAKYFYPKVGTRPGSGLIDSERYLLNALLLATKCGEDQTWEHVDQLCEKLSATASLVETVYPESNMYLREHVMPLLMSYIRALRIANLPANCLFNKAVTVETGQICNLGQAYHEYKAIASRPDLPLTLNHERAFGKNGELASEGTVYRLAPSNVARRASNISGQNKLTQGFTIEQLDLVSTSSADGQSVKRHFFQMECNHSYRLQDLTEPAIIGQIATRNLNA